MNSTGGMNGGKMEKVSAFVLAAAIYSTLDGDGHGSLPYAPLVLDESFVKSDARTTSAAFNALKRFGYQLIVVAPEEKFQTVETLSDRFYIVTRKDDESPAALGTMADNVTGRI